jgi:amino acid adenylation domain-containing protein
MSNNVEAIYPLSPMQEGMLFHSVYAPGTGVYVNQVAYTFAGLDTDAFRRAWQGALDRHGALRTAFLWEKRDRPLQAVLRAVELPWDERDWRGLDGEAQRAALQALMREDRERGYALNRPPATRLYVMRTADDEHRVLWSFHHLVLDGWSMSLLLGEVFRLYDALRGGESPALPPAPQYRAYITWLQAQRPEAAEAFWRAALDGVRAPTPLGIDRDGEPVPADAPERFGGRMETMDPALAAEVQAFARRHRVTPNAVAQGAWALLLSRYSGEADVVFGVTVSGRPPAVPGAEQTVGLFINTIPCRVPVRDGVRVGEWLEAIQARHGAAQQHDHVPLVQVQGWSQVPRDQPLFESLLVFQNFPSQRAGRERGGVEVREVKVAESTSVPLNVVVGIGAESFVKLMWDRTRIADAAADRLMRHLPAALAAIVRDGGRRLGELDVLGADERALLLDGLNPAPRPYPAPRCVHQLVEAQVDRTPDATALVHGTRTVTYAQLDAEANRIARHLRALGVGPETPVGVCASRTPSLVAALLGVMKAGGAYLPLDPAYPADRLGFMLEDARAPVVLTEAAFVDRLPVDGARVVCLDRDAAQLAAHPAERMDGGAGPRNLAYFIYTSGSTGRPKGVMIEHASVDTLVRWSEETFSPEEMATVLASTSICFDMSVFELFAALALGSRVVLADNALHFPALPAAGEVTLVNTVPSAGAELLHAGAIPPSVRTMNLGGEPLKRALADAMFAAGVARVCNLYGPSEDTTYSTIEDARPGEAGETPIGVPLANTRGYILDAAGRLAPRGVLGELFLAGEGVSRGYLRRPALTAERYLPDPFSPVPGGRMYRTGDRVRWMADGRMECLGRLDHQVKIRGFRVEIGEVEAALASHPAVRETVVMAREGADGTPRLLAWAASDDASLTGQALAEHAAGRLPGYMVPAAVMVLPALPLNPNGKIDRKALPEPGAAARAADAHVPPRDALEAQVAALFGEVLSVDGVGATDSFFALGGHSLLAMRLVAKVEERHGVRLPLSALFEGPTVARLAERLRGGPARRPAQTLVALRAEGDRPPLFCVHGGDGHLLTWAPLLPHLPADLPVYAFQAPGVDDGAEPLASVDAMAERYVAEVKRVQPEGPYHLAGWSFGALVARQMARRLDAAGDEVQGVVMLDPHLFADDGDDDDVFLAQLFGERLPAGFSVDEFRALDAEGRLAYIARHAASSPLLPADASPEALRALLRVRRAHLAAQRRHRPEPWDGPAVVLRATELAPAARATAQAWDAAAPEAEVVSVPGSHYSMMREPHAAAVAAALADALDRAAVPAL